MPRLSFSSSLPHAVGAILSTALWAFVCCAFTAVSANAQVTLLVPSQPSIEAPAKTDKADASGKRDDKKQESKQPAPKPEKSADTAKTAASARKPEAAPAAEQGAAKTPAAQGTPQQGTQPAAEAPASPPPPELPVIDEQVDVLITMMRPFQYQSLVMDMPQLFAALRYDNASPVKDGLIQPARRDLLGDVEKSATLIRKPGEPTSS